MKNGNILINFFILFLLASCAVISKKDKIEKNVNNVQCVVVNISFKDEKIEDLYFNNLLKTKISSRVDMVNKNQLGNTDELPCELVIDIQKRYTNSLINTTGSVAGQNIRYYINYSLNKENKVLKDGNFFIFYNTKISKYQYSNKVLSEKEGKNIINKISNKIFMEIKNIFI